MDGVDVQWKSKGKAGKRQWEEREGVLITLFFCLPFLNILIAHPPTDKLAARKCHQLCCI